MRTTTPVDTATLRQLFSVPGPVVSVYFNLTALPDQDIWLRWNALTDRLARQGTDPATIEVLTQKVSASLPGSGVIAVFATTGELLLSMEMPGSGQPDLAMHGPLPHVLPLLAWMQERPAHVVAVVDRTGADIEAYPDGAITGITQTVTGPDDEIERNAPGGWSQMRYQHRAEDSWEHNAVRVVDALTRTLTGLGARLLLLAGDVRALQYLTRHLPVWVRHEVAVRHVCGSRSQDGSWNERLAQVEAQTRHAAQEQTQALLRRLAEERSPAGGAAEGIRDTLDALAHGRVRTLVVVDDPQVRRSGWYGPGPTQVSDQRTALARVAAPIVRAPLVDVAVRAAVLTGAEVRVVQPGTPGAPAQGIGALCRFPATSAQQGPAAGGW